VASRAAKRPQLRAHERGLLVVLASLLPRWRDALLLVKPDANLRWHREGFRLVWRRRSRRTAGAKSRVAADVIGLIRRMARQNRLWGSERIRGELLKLGIPSQRTDSTGRGESGLIPDVLQMHAAECRKS
jgi:hypothetical protein